MRAAPAALVLFAASATAPSPPSCASHKTRAACPPIACEWSGAACAAKTIMTVEMYSDAQCPVRAQPPLRASLLRHQMRRQPRYTLLTRRRRRTPQCSAQATSDFKALLDDPEFAAVDFKLWFVGGGITGTEPGKCIHGEGECVGQRFFSCAQNMSLPSGAGLEPVTFPPSYRESPLWLEFQRCSYGACDGSAAILGPSHPCKTYTTFTETTKNTIMKDCATKLNISWTALAQCGLGARGQALMTASGEYAKKHKVEYGLQGLPVVRVKVLDTFTQVKTKKLIPIVCGPSPEEVLKAICSAPDTWTAATYPSKCPPTAALPQ